MNCFNFGQVLLQHQGSIDILGHIQCSGLQPLLTALLVNVLPPSFKKATLTGLDHSVLGNSVFFFFFFESSKLNISKETISRQNHSHINMGNFSALWQFIEEKVGPYF